MGKGHSLLGSVDWNAMEKGSLEFGNVTPFLGVWIEMLMFSPPFCTMSVTPFLGVWIEITRGCSADWRRECHSLLGSVDWNGGIWDTVKDFTVTPFLGVWIEIWFKKYAWRDCKGHSLLGSVDWNRWKKAQRSCRRTVTPFLGVWIEILLHEEVRGFTAVTPFLGVWIEMELTQVLEYDTGGHSLLGSVDWNSHGWCSEVRRMQSLPSWECGLKSDLLLCFGFRS